MADPTISLCMIVKNEGNHLERCLNSAKKIVDEIVIADTGSKDDTKEVAKKFGAKIVDFKWSDDFSAARNESIKHATKDWILVLDADEELDEEGLKQIKERVNDKENDAFLFLQKNYTDNSSVADFVPEEHKKGGKKYSGWHGSFIARLFRNKKGYQFEGFVHELVEPSIERKGGKIIVTNIALHHYGDSDPNVVMKKREFYLELCKKKAAQNKDASSYYELGILYKENEDLKNARLSLKMAIELDPMHSQALFELGIIDEKEKNYDDAISNYTKSLKIKETSNTFENRGVCYLKLGMFKEAYGSLVKAMLLDANKYTIYSNLGAVLERSGNLDSASNMLEISVKLNPNNTIGFYNLGIVFDKKGDFENAIKNYERAVELGHKNKDEIKKRILELRVSLSKTPKYKFGFKVGS